MHSSWGQVRAGPEAEIPGVFFWTTSTSGVYVGSVSLGVSCFVLDVYGRIVVVVAWILVQRF
jgi:hypothetical protein